MAPQLRAGVRVELVSAELVDDPSPEITHALGMSVRCALVAAGAKVPPDELADPSRQLKDVAAAVAI